MIIFCLFLLISLIEGEPHNFIPNGGFELDQIDDPKQKNWHLPNKENSYCKRVTDEKHSGKYSLYCNDQDETTNLDMYSSSSGDIIPGLRYNVSCYFKLKNVKNGDLLLSLGGGGTMGIWEYSSKVAECKDGTCDDEWYYMWGVSGVYFQEKSKYSFAAVLHPEKATGEFWIDDYRLDVAEETYLLSVDVIAWRQEVFEDPVEVRVSTTLYKSAFETGKYSQYKLYVINEKDETVWTSQKFYPWYNIDQTVISMQLEPKELKPGNYKLRVSFYNNLTEALETVSTTFRKVDKKKDYKIFVDNDLRTFVDGELFFPLGAYVYDVKDEDISNFADSPFNIMKIDIMEKSMIDKIYEQSNHRLRVIPQFTGSITKDKTKIQEKLDWAKKKIDECKNSEGLFAYYLADEPSIEYLPSMIETTKLARDIDSNHPLWAVILDRNKLNEFKEGLDTVGLDCYPLQTYDELQAPKMVTMKARRLIGNSRAMWNIPQIFDWRVYYESFKNSHIQWDKEGPPTEEQLTNMVYQWIAAGGMGIIYYHYSEVVAMHPTNDFQTEWNKIKKVSKELMDKYSKIIMSNAPVNPDYKMPVYDVLYNNIGWRLFRYNHKDYILLVNALTEEDWITFCIPRGVTLKKISGISELNGIDEDSCTWIGLKSMEVMWLEGSGGDYDVDESNYEKPNMKSRFNEEKSMTNEDMGEFPDGGDNGGKSDDPKTGNATNTMILMVILAILMFL